ncbi:hypothetical protein [Paraflavitalea pollutisoli]|uniref:hypothetical protein n=1 Tax=Paraflavitalea pollutisoli TaxID=3034143 RepID=UPI0023EC4C2A|nr:hypothetical protein [Paraflavitalea sp. H1-2-19X]
MNLIACFVISTQQEQLLDILQQYSGFETIVNDAPIQAAVCEVLADIDADPTLYVVNGGKDRILIEVNSYKKLHDLARQVSSDLQTVFFQVCYNDLVGYAYFLLYDQGELVREIESRGSKKDPDVNYGFPLTFEEDGEVTFFDLDMIAEFCEHLGVDVGNLYEDPTCTVLQGATSRPMVRLDQDKQLSLLFYPLG